MNTQDGLGIGYVKSTRIFQEVIDLLTEDIEAHLFKQTMRKLLVVSDEWYNWFCNDVIELVTTIDNRESFTESIQGELDGNQINYQTVFKLLDAFTKAFNFLQVEEIRLMWCEELNDLQFYYSGQDYEIWKENVLKNEFIIDWQSFAEYEDPTEIFYNYSISVNNENKSLHKYNSLDRTAIYLWYNPLKNITHYLLEIELKKSLFRFDDYCEINLSNCYTEQNMKVLEMSKHKFLNELKSSD